MLYKSTESVKWLYEKSKPHILKLVILTVLGCAMSVLSIMFALVSKDVVDAATGAVGKDFKTETIKLVVFLILQLAGSSAVAFLYNVTVGKIRITLKTDLFKSILNKDMLKVSKYHTGELSNRLNSDINLIADSITDIVPSSISLITSIVLGIYTLFKLEPIFSIICLIIGPVIVVAARFYRNKFKSLHKRYQETDGLTRSFMQDCLQNMLVIKSFRNESKILSNLETLQINNFKTGMKRNNVSIIANILFYLTVTAGYYLALAWGAYRISTGAITFGTLTAMLSLVGDAVTPFKSLSSLFPKFFQTTASAERIMEIEAISDEVKDVSENAKTDFSDFEKIVFENVSFSYNEENTVLKDFNGEIKKGDFVSINGRSGIGKSTLLKLMLGIMKPQSGRIYAVCGGKEIPLTASSRGLFSYVPQGNMILTGTIEENIAFSTGEIDEKRVLESAKTAEIEDVINSLGEGIKTKLGEGGAGLSEGQVQRLAIARAIYHNSPILLFDEATSSLDKDTEMKILNNLSRLDSKTLIIVSHRKEVLNFCSKNINISVDKSK